SLPHLLRLSGNPREMGRAHGQAMKDAGAFDAVRFYSEFLDSVFKFEMSGKLDQWLRRKFRRFISETLERSLSDMLPESYREMIRGYSESSGLSYEALVRGHIMPDAYSFLVSRRYSLRALVAMDSVHL